MENNPTVPTNQPTVSSVQPEAQQPVVNPSIQTVSSPVSTSPQVNPRGGAGKKILLVVVLVLLLAGVLGGGYYLYLNNNKTTHNVSSYNAPTTSVTPTPQAYQPNPNDTSNQALTNDSNAAAQNLNNIDSSLNAVDQGLSDKPTNLQ